MLKIEENSTKKVRVAGEVKKMAKSEESSKCGICYKKHKMVDCPLYEDVKELIIARLKRMPDDAVISIG